MEVPDEVGRALPVPENATSVRAWKFTDHSVDYKVRVRIKQRVF
jgi:hypothetical protein